MANYIVPTGLVTNVIYRNVDGTGPTQSSIDVDGGAALRPGTNTVGLAAVKIGTKFGVYGSQVAETGTSNTKYMSVAGRALRTTGATFAKMTAGSYVMRLVSTTLAGVANTAIRQAGSQMPYRVSIHQASGVYIDDTAARIRAGCWVEFSGGWQASNLAILPESIPSGYKVSATWGKDDAATPTAATPGELQYQDGTNTPNQDEYKARYLW